MMQNIVNEYLSPLILLIFVIAILAVLADARPETVIKMVLDAVVSIFDIIFKFAARIFEIIFKIVDYFWMGKKPAPRKYPPKGQAKKTRRKPGPASNIKLVEVEILPPK